MKLPYFTNWTNLAIIVMWFQKVLLKSLREKGTKILELTDSSIFVLVKFIWFVSLKKYWEPISVSIVYPFLYRIFVSLFLFSFIEIAFIFLTFKYASVINLPSSCELADIFAILYKKHY